MEELMVKFLYRNYHLILDANNYIIYTETKTHISPPVLESEIQNIFGCKYKEAREVCLAWADMEDKRIFDLVSEKLSKCQVVRGRTSWDLIFYGEKISVKEFLKHTFLFDGVSRELKPVTEAFITDTVNAYLITQAQIMTHKEMGID